jgi:hypothetical protein
MTDKPKIRNLKDQKKKLLFDTLWKKYMIEQNLMESCMLQVYLNSRYVNFLTYTSHLILIVLVINTYNRWFEKFRRRMTF